GEGQPVLCAGRLGLARTDGRQNAVELGEELGLESPLGGGVRPAWALAAQGVACAQRLDSLGELPLIAQSEAQVAVRLRVACLEADGLGVGRLRLPVPPLPVQGEAEGVVRLG